MTRYEDLASGEDAKDIIIYNRNFVSSRIKGLYCDGSVAISNNIDTNAERACILAEELGHHATSSGNILDQNGAGNRKQERTARLWAYNRLVGLDGLIDCYKAGCRSRYEIAEHLDITEEFLSDALECYRQKYGIYTIFDNYVIYFEPTIGVFELI
ncbi:MAG: ImmA/IrrE family metallo-endopeptidase [Lachnospiraceae bacterium]